MDNAWADRPLLIHIGYHKTGTTWFQRTLFVPENGYFQLLDHHEINEALVRPYPLAFDPGDVALRLAGPLARLPRGCVPVLSSEILSGNPFYGARDCVLCAERLRTCFPNARILITIREQIAAIASTYMQYVRRAGTLSPEGFFDFESEPGYGAFDPRHFEYDRLVAEYRRLFGPDNVLVVTNEALATNATAVAMRLAEFSGATWPHAVSSTRVGASAPESAVGLLRLVNRLRRGPTSTATLIDLGTLGLWLHRGSSKLYQLPPLKHLAKRRPVLEAARARYAGSFAESNRRLVEMIGPMADLSRYEGVNMSVLSSQSVDDPAFLGKNSSASKLKTTQS
ncbi:sulfotransferase (plasmid) [Salipiger sp. H15]|uniref:Sulfotransferase n=1 Tax=Alloyangia sp. H15 TaxID=3029062 RepID=A0AAU8AR14_9RHOB